MFALKTAVCKVLQFMMKNKEQTSTAAFG